ncbi:hypothetical protein D3C76_1187610 [compost metagenome]
MHAGDGLHQRAVAVFQPFAIERFQATNVRGAVLRQLNVLPLLDVARHAQRPHPLIAQLAGGKAVNVAHQLQHVVNIAIDGRNELQQRFGEIGCDPFMCQRRA